MARQLYIPKRFKGRTGYQIFVDRYCRAGKAPVPMEGRRIKSWNDSQPDWQPDRDGVYRNEYFYGGNLNGITEKLDYIKELGIDLLYLSPISKTHTNHHYDVEDQTELDPYIGNWNDFMRLCDKAHERGMLVAVDLVFNHMGAKSKFFQMALAGDGKYRKWFEWNERNNPIYWYGFTDMPQCNKFDEDYQEYACDVVEEYIYFGADCIRLDLGEILPRKFLMRIKERARQANPEVLIVSEMWESAVYKENPQIYDGQVDSLMNYPLSDAISLWVRTGNFLHLNACLGNLAKYPIEVQDVLWNHLDTHDTPRELNILAGNGMIENPFYGRIWDVEKMHGATWRTNYGFDTYAFRKWESENDGNLAYDAISKLKIAAVMKYTMKGIPILFYGTEVGIVGNKDPFNRKPYPWENENKELRNFYVGLGKYRKNNKDILSDGDIYVNGDTKVVEIIRRNKNGIIVTFVNRTSDVQKINAHYPNSELIFTINGSDKDWLQPYGVTICRF